MLFWLWALTTLVCLTSPTIGLSPVSASLLSNNKAENTIDGPYSWLEEYFKGMPVDHFNGVNPATFNLRYFINLTYYVDGGPIFFYTGNEGQLEMFAQSTGLMWELAPEYKAAVVFVEHRYYGKSKPFGKKSFANIQYLRYLSVDQSLADFALTIPYFKQKVCVDESLLFFKAEHRQKFSFYRIPNAVNSPVILFGGFFGGMLAAWMRIKYPHLTQGAIASSAPVFWFGNKTNHNAFSHVEQRTYVSSGCDADAIYSTMVAVGDLALTKNGRDYINTALRLNADSKVTADDDSGHIVLTALNILDTVALVDYPYPANFLQDLPAWPAKEICKGFVKKGKTLEKQVDALYNVFNVWFNRTGNVKEICLRGNKCESEDQSDDAMGWTWQTCTELVMPMCNSGPPNDFLFETCPYSFSSMQDYCTETYKKIGYNKSLFTPNYVEKNFGFNYSNATNIVFTNGYLDPWSAGGWSLETKTVGSLISFIIKDGAHLVDLRSANPADTPDIIKAREIKKTAIASWIKEHKKKINLPL